MKANKPLNRKILCLGVDGMDPRFTSWMLEHGKMPNTQKIIDRGAARKDLVLLGGIPTVTPPMWTTLATGAYPNTHGITGFYRASDKGQEYIEYNLDSRYCKAEPVWNATAEAGMKTLVWHWPGSSWPPTSDSENLHVVDGTSPGAVGMSTSLVEGEFLFGATKDFTEPRVIKAADTDAVAPCVVTDLKLDSMKEGGSKEGIVDMEAVNDHFNNAFSDIATTWTSGQGGSTTMPITRVISPLQPADQSKWDIDVTDALEFVVLFSKGTVRRYGLALRGQSGEYDHIALYKNRKADEPITVINNGEFKREIVDEAIKNDEHLIVNRNARLLELDPKGEFLRMWWSNAMDTQKDEVWHPKRLFKTVTENIGYLPPTTLQGQENEELITDVMLENWENSVDWQGDALNYLIDNEGYDAVFSHFHNIDLQSHMIIRYMSDQPGKEGHPGPLFAEGQHLSPEKHHEFMEHVYEQTDRYLGKFVHYLDEGWTIFVFSDHAQLCPAHGYRLMGDMEVCNVKIMQELGLTTLLKDENGKDKRAIDWTKTYAIAVRENSIYLNIKGRDKHTLPDGTVIDGLIDPKDQYEWEEEIMTRLYGYKDPVTGKRIIGLALRNREAAILGLSGPEMGDIVYTMAEGYTWDHGESLSTSIGEGDTSVSPIFFCAGKGIKNCTTDRVIREVDVAPTIAAIAGVRMPHECEGAPAYQIIED